MTGSVALGAATLRHEDRGELKARALSPSAVIGTVGAGVSARVVRAAGRASKGDTQRHRARVDPAPLETVDPGSSGTATPPPPRSEAPTDGSTPSIAPAPPFSLGFVAEISSSSTCNCSAGELVLPDVSGDAENGYVFDQSYRGAALDADGDRAWALDVQYSVSTAPGGGVDAKFTLTGDGGAFAYTAAAPLDESASGDDGVTVYRFVGQYVSSDEMPAGVQAPVGGQLSVSVRFSRDGTLNSVDFVLHAG